MSEPSKEELLIGRIALHNKLITQEQLDEAMVLRAKRKDETQDLGRILRAKGYLDEKGYKAARKAQEKHLTSKGMSADEARLAARGLSGAAGKAALAAEDAEPTGDGEEPSTIAAPATTRLDPKKMSGTAAAVAAAPPKAEEPAHETVPAEPAEAPQEFRTEDAAANQEEEEETPEERARRLERLKRPIDETARKTMLSLLKKARESGASDLHMSAGAKPFLRINGAPNFLNMPVLTDAQNKLYFAQIMNDRQWAHFMEKNDWDGSIDLGKDGRFRTNVLKQRRGVSGVFRVIKGKVPRLQELALPESLEKFTTYHQGLVLVTGSTGSGKSSTLAALIELINETRQDHVITLEDPIEYIFQSKKCNVTQRQIELHTQSWANALRGSLREDPDVIMIGEMRDLETVELAITASETGHLVFGTLHTTNATRTIDRLLDVFPPKEQAQIRAMVSESLKGVVSQQLVPRADGKGRVCAVEILFWTPAVANLIREKRTFQLFSVMQTGRKLGMQLMDDSLMDHLKAGAITKEEARRRATNPKLFGG